MTPSDISVIICAYTLDRWDELQRAVQSVLDQDPPPGELILVVDHNPELLRRLHEHVVATAEEARQPGVRVIDSTGAPGIAGARNCGVAAARGSVVAFLDDDARAEPGWMRGLVDAYCASDVVACGGDVLPDMQAPRPSWFPGEFDWVVGCSYLGLPTERTAVRNLIGANMSARRDAIRAAGGFPEGVGRVGKIPLGCEETFLCIRLGEAGDAARIIFDPGVRVRHSVPKNRMSWRYFRSRCYAEGLSKALIADQLGCDRALGSERSYVLRVLPLGFWRGLREALGGRPAAAIRSAALAAGLLITTAGYLRGRFTPRRSLPAGIRGAA